MRNKKQYTEWFRFKTTFDHEVIVYTNGKLKYRNIFSKWKTDGKEISTKSGRFGMWEKQNNTVFGSRFMTALENAVDKQILDG